MSSNSNVGYIRVSSYDQNPERQLNGVHLDKRFEDRESGSNTNRPGFKACMEYLREGDTLHIHSLDRLARSLSDLKKTIETLRERGVTIQFHQEKLTFPAQTEEASPLTDLHFHILGAFAEFERAIIRIRQREGILAAQKRGKKLGRPTKITESIIASVLTAKSNGDDPKEICQRFNISKASYYNILKDNKSSPPG